MLVIDGRGLDKTAARRIVKAVIVGLTLFEKQVDHIPGGYEVQQKTRGGLIELIDTAGKVVIDQVIFVLL